MTDTPKADPSRDRRLARALFLAFVGLQLVVPTSYYLRSDPFDERFAWRMFSGIRVLDCASKVLYTRAGSEAASGPDTTVHGAWFRHLERGRRSVIDRYLAHRCEDGLAESVALENACRDANDRNLPIHRWERTCPAGPVRESAIRLGAVDDQ